MTYIRNKKIGNNIYQYEEKSIRSGGKTKTIHVRYIGKLGGTTGSINRLKTAILKRDGGENINTFIKKNIKDLKENDLLTEEKINDFEIKTKLETYKNTPLTKDEAVAIINKDLNQQTSNRWFREEDKSAKPKLVKSILSKEKVLNAGRNISYYNYLAYNNLTKKDLSFNNFLKKEIKVYRGGSLLEKESFTSFSLDKKVASKFNKDNIITGKIKIGDTLGGYQTTAEQEILIPKRNYRLIKWE